MCRAEARPWRPGSQHMHKHTRTHLLRCGHAPLAPRQSGAPSAADVRSRQCGDPHAMGVGRVHMEARCLRAGAGKGPGRHGGVEGGVGGGRQCRPCQRTRGRSPGKDGVGQLESVGPGENRLVGHVGTRDPLPLPCRGKVSGRSVRPEGLKGRVSGERAAMGCGGMLRSGALPRSGGGEAGGQGSCHRWQQ